jgi:hypothetical protein
MRLTGRSRVSAAPRAILLTMALGGCQGRTAPDVQQVAVSSGNAPIHLTPAPRTSFEPPALVEAGHMTAFDAWLRADAAMPRTYAVEAPVSFSEWSGLWKIVKQGQSAHVTPGDCDRIGRILSLAPNRITYADDGCEDRNGLLRLP